jgi:TetR/AcrR family fatty acid metabolism transcriptional regulator
MPKIAASERDAFYEARRTTLQEVALRLWAERGFDATSVERIARAAGISKGSFYLYFESKQALLEEVMRQNSLVPVLQALIADLHGAPLEESVRAFVTAAWRHLHEKRALLLVALRELPTHLDQAQQVLEHVMAPANRLIEAHLAAHLPAGRDREISLLIAGRSLLGTFLTQEVLGLGRVLPVPEDEIAHTLAEVFLHGVTGGGEPRAL